MSERDTLLILGAGGHGKVVADTARAAGWRAIRFFDDALTPGTPIGDWSVEGPFKASLAACAQHHVSVIVAIGDNPLRLEWLQRLEAADARGAIVIAPSAVVSPLARIGAGSVVVAGAIIAIDAIVGRACIVSTAATVDHDCVIADGVHISPGARLGGSVRVDTCAWIGIGASVRHRIHVGANAIIGAGAAVVHDVEAETTVVGVPARPLVPRPDERK